MKKKLLTLCLAGTLVIGGTSITSPLVNAAGNGPNYGGNETINTSILTTYQEMVDFLEKQEAKQERMEIEVIGQTVKGRDIHLVKYISNPENPTILYLTQQHGNEQLTTEGTLEFIKHLGTGKTKGVLDHVNVLILPMLNADGAMGDVNFSLEDYIASGDRHLTRYNANGVDINRDHIDKIEPETQALHENVLQKYDIDYMIDLHHQGADRVINGDELVSGSILYPTTPNVKEDVVEKSKQLGAVVYNELSPKGWALLGKYPGGSAETIARNGVAVQYDIATLLFEMRGMSDHNDPSRVIGQKSNGYLIKQTVNTLDATLRAVADGSINNQDVSFWDTLPEQTTKTNE